jgi:hypothetical protein
VTFDVRVIPNAARTGFTGTRDGEYVLRINAPPRDGKANREATRFLAGVFSVARSRVRIVRGENSRHKRVEILGLDSARGITRLKNLIEISGESDDRHGKEETGSRSV